MWKGSPLLALYSSISMIAFSAGSYNPLIPLFAQHLGATYMDLGLIGAAYSVPYLILPIFVGSLSDRFDRRYFFSTGIVLTAITPLLFILASDVKDLIIIRLFGGIAYAFMWPSIEALIVDLTTVEERVKAMGRYSFSWAIGFLLGPPVGGLVLERTDFPHLFLGASAVGAFAAATACLGMLSIKLSSEEMGVEVSGQKTANSAFLRIYIVIITYSMALGLIFSIFPAYVSSFNITSFQIGVLFAMLGVSRTLMFLQSENVSKIGVREALSLALIIQAVSLTGMAYLTSFESFMMLMALIGSAVGIFSPLTLSTISRMAPRRRIGMSIGFTEAVFGTGMTLGPFIGGISAQMLGASSPFIIVAAVSAAIVIPIFKGRITLRQIVAW